MSFFTISLIMLHLLSFPSHFLLLRHGYSPPNRKNYLDKFSIKYKTSHWKSMENGISQSIFSLATIGEILLNDQDTE